MSDKDEHALVCVLVSPELGTRWICGKATCECRVFLAQRVPTPMWRDDSAYTDEEMDGWTFCFRCDEICVDDGSNKPMCIGGCPEHCERTGTLTHPDDVEECGFLALCPLEPVPGLSPSPASGRPDEVDLQSPTGGRSPAAALFDLELAVECDQLDARIQVAVHDARLEVRAAFDAHAAVATRSPTMPHLKAATMAGARLKWMKLCGLLLLVVLLALVGCGDNLCGEVTLVDARPPVDAALPTCTFDDVQRSEECKVICFQEWMRCPGASGDACYDECRAFQTGVAYCPPMSSARAPRKAKRKSKSKRKVTTAKPTRRKTPARASGPVYEHGDAKRCAAHTLGGSRCRFDVGHLGHHMTANGGTWTQGAQVSVYLRQSALHRARGLLVDGKA